jgi:hypothetical protein
MPNYQPFLISEFKTGLNTLLKPWIRPADAFEPLTNAYVYRGILKKRNGSTKFGNQLAEKKPVMGIMQFVNETTSAIKLVIATTQNAYLYNPGTTPDGGTFTLLDKIGGLNSIFWKGTTVAVSTVYPGLKTFWPYLVPNSVVITLYDSTGTAKATANHTTGVWVFGGTGDIEAVTAEDFVTGVFSLKIKTAYVDATLGIEATTLPLPLGAGSYFTGDITSFFNWTNWQATSNITAISPSYLYMVNGVDPVTIFDGTYLARPILYIDSTYRVNNKYIMTALDVKTYANRLLLFRPTTTANPTDPNNQDIAYSAQYSPFNFVNDVAGNGGVVSAATGDRIMSSEFLRDNLIVAFSNSTWSFQVTGLKDPPFIFRKLNISKSTQCPYASVAYDERVTNLGNTGFFGTDGYNFQRVDMPIIDYYETEISQKYFNQDYSLRYDNLNQTWMFYPSITNKNAKTYGAPGSDKTLVYNFLEETYATYTNSFPMTCIGFFYVPEGTTWADLNVPVQDYWENTQVAWNSYSFQSSGRLLLGGDDSGNIYHLDNPIAEKDGENGTTPTSFNVDIKTTRWNPFMQTGQKTQFGYIDIYYNFASVDPANPIQVTLNFFVDNSNEVAAKRTLTFDGRRSTAFDKIATGTGAAAYTGAIVGAFIIPGTFEVSVVTSSGIEAFTDNGSGVLVGDLGDVGSIVYKTGAWTLTFLGGRTVAAGVAINADYEYNDVDGYNWKRIYCNLMGEFIQIQIDPSEDAPFEILGFILWARPAGRLTQ